MQRNLYLLLAFFGLVMSVILSIGAYTGIDYLIPQQGTEHKESRGSQPKSDSSDSLTVLKRNSANIELEDIGNIVIDKTFSNEERQILKNTLLEIDFPVEKLGDIFITSSIYSPEEYAHHSVAHTIEDENSQQIIIEFNDNTYQGDMAKILTHELGHVYHKRLGDGVLFFDYKTIRNIPSDIRYDTKVQTTEDWKSSVREDFAEIFVVYYFDSSYQIRTNYDPDVLNDQNVIDFFNKHYQSTKNWLTYTEIENGERISQYSLAKLAELPGEVYIPGNQIHEEITSWSVDDNDECVNVQANIGNLDNLSPYDIYTSYRWEICPVEKLTENKYTESGWYNLIENPASSQIEKPAYVLITDNYVYTMYFGQYYKTIKAEEKPHLEKRILSFDKI